MLPFIHKGGCFVMRGGGITISVVGKHARLRSNQCQYKWHAASPQFKVYAHYAELRLNKSEYKSHTSLPSAVTSLSEWLVYV